MKLLSDPSRDFLNADIAQLGKVHAPLLRQNGCLTYEEIAKLRHSPVGTVKTQMRAAAAKLRQVLREK